MTRANSWSWATANSCGDSPTPTTSTTVASAIVTITSAIEIVVIEPKRYSCSRAELSPPRPLSRTPPARPP